MMNLEIGKNITALRLAAGKSQREVAEAIGVDRNLYKHWECGTRQIKAVHVVLLARYFDVSADAILDTGKASESILLEEIEKLRKAYRLANRFCREMETLL